MSSPISPALRAVSPQPSLENTQNNFDIERTDKDLLKRCFLVASRGELKTAKELLGQIRTLAILESQNISGTTPLHWAAGYGYEEIVRFLLEKISPKALSLQSNEGYTALHYAVDNKHGKIVRLLLEKMDPKEVQIQNKAGDTALIFAAIVGYKENVSLLLEKTPAEAIPTKNNKGYTALHWAAKEGHEEIVRLLLEKMPLNAIQTKNQFGNTESDLAKTEMIKSLIMKKMPLLNKPILLGGSILEAIPSFTSNDDDDDETDLISPDPKAIKEDLDRLLIKLSETNINTRMKLEAKVFGLSKTRPQFPFPYNCALTALSSMFLAGKYLFHEEVEALGVSDAKILKELLTSPNCEVYSFDINDGNFINPLDDRKKYCFGHLFTVIQYPCKKPFQEARFQLVQSFVYVYSLKYFFENLDGKKLLTLNDLIETVIKPLHSISERKIWTEETAEQACELTKTTSYFNNFIGFQPKEKAAQLSLYLAVPVSKLPYY